MALTGEQLRQLHRALISAFPHTDSLRLMVSTGLRECLTAIPWGADLNTIVLDLIVWAESHGKLEVLVENACSANPESVDLQRFAKQVLGISLVLPDTGSSSSQPGRNHPETKRPGEHCSPKIKILFLAANPSGTVQLNLGKEVRDITEKIHSSNARDQIEIVQAHAVRPDDLRRELLRHQPHIVHFSGHGSEQEEIILEDLQGAPFPLSLEALAGLFRILKDNVQVVVLNACFSRPQADAITASIPCAIGMKNEIDDTAAIAFASAFYEGIGFGRSIQTSFDLGLNALLIYRVPDKDTPVLLTHDGLDPTNFYPLNPS